MCIMFSFGRRKQKVRPTPRSARPFRPRVELLEDRVAPAILTVTTTADELDGGTLADRAGPDGKLSLREAISVANLSAGPDVILLPSGTYGITIAGTGEDTNATGDFDITGDLTIQMAPGALTRPIIDGNGLDRVFDIPTGSTGISLTFIQVQITGGVVSGGAGVHGPTRATS